MAWGWIDDAEWRAVLRQLNRIEYSLKILTKEGRIEMAAIDDLVREVEETKGVAESVKTAFGGIKTQLAEVQAALEAALASNNTEGIAKAAADLDAIQAGLTELLPAVVANSE